MGGGGAKRAGSGAGDAFSDVKGFVSVSSARRRRATSSSRGDGLGEGGRAAFGESLRARVPGDAMAARYGFFPASSSEALFSPDDDSAGKSESVPDSSKSAAVRDTSRGPNESSSSEDDNVAIADIARAGRSEGRPGDARAPWYDADEDARRGKGNKQMRDRLRETETRLALPVEVPKLIIFMRIYRIIAIR